MSAGWGEAEDGLNPGGSADVFALLCSGLFRLAKMVAGRGGKDVRPQCLRMYEVAGGEDRNPDFRPSQIFTLPGNGS